MLLTDYKVYQIQQSIIGMVERMVATAIGHLPAVRIVVGNRISHCNILLHTWQSTKSAHINKEVQSSERTSLRGGCVLTVCQDYSFGIYQNHSRLGFDYFDLNKDHLTKGLCLPPTKEMVTKKYDATHFIKGNRNYCQWRSTSAHQSYLTHMCLLQMDAII